MTERFENFVPKPETPSEDEFLEPGWQNRVADEIREHPKTEEKASKFRFEIIETLDGRQPNPIILTAFPRDAALVASIARRELEDRPGTSGPLKPVEISAESVDDVITSAYMVSALVDPTKDIGEVAGYSTGHGRIGEQEMVRARTSGITQKRALGGLLTEKSLSAVVVADADGSSMRNQLLLGALKEQIDNGTAPLTILLSGKEDRTEALVEFFGLPAKDRTHQEDSHSNKSRGGKAFYLPEDVRYENVEGPDRGRTVEWATRILKSVTERPEHKDQNVIVFLPGGEEVQDVANAVFRRPGAPRDHRAQAKTHVVRTLTSEVPIRERIGIELGRPSTSVDEENKPMIILTSMSADTLGTLGRFDIVIDSSRSRQSRRTLPLSKDEAKRRASFTHHAGVLYRLTTEREYFHGASQVGNYKITETDQHAMEMILEDAGRDPETFPSIAERKHPSRKKIQETPEVERWRKGLAVEPHVARLVDAFEKRGQIELGLALAAISRENRILEDGVSPKKLYGYLSEDALDSDMLAALEILRLHYESGKSKDTPIISEGVVSWNRLDHLTDMLESRWARFQGRPFDSSRLVQQIRQLNQDDLSSLLLQVMPEQLATDGATPYYIDGHIPGDLRHGKRSLLYYPTPIYVVFASMDRFINSAHPVKPELVARAFPNKFEVQESDPYTVTYRNGESGVMKKRSLVVADGSTIELGVHEATEDEVAAHREKEQQAAIAKESVSRRLESSLEASVAALNMIQSELDPSDALLTSARSRLAAIEATKRLGSTNIEAADEAAKGQNEKVTQLSKKVATKKRWSSDWFGEFKSANDNLRDAISGHVFAQEVIGSNAATTEQIEQLARAEIRESGLKLAQSGRKIDLDEVIDLVLDTVVSQ